jgi:hypothetical protein
MCSDSHESHNKIQELWKLEIYVGSHGCLPPDLWPKGKQWSRGGSVGQWLQIHFNDEPNPDSHQFEKSDTDAHQSKKPHPDRH